MCTLAAQMDSGMLQIGGVAHEWCLEPSDCCAAVFRVQVTFEQLYIIKNLAVANVGMPMARPGHYA